MNQRLLNLRNGLKAKKPNFRGQDSHKRKRISKSWKKPKGLQSKIRHGFKGKQRKVNVGYRSPKEVRGLDRNGLSEVMVYSLKDLEKVGEGGVAILASDIGINKRITLLRKAKDEHVGISNVKDIDVQIKKMEERINSRKLAKKEAVKEKESKKKEREDKAKEKKPELEKKVEEAEDQKKKKEEEKKELNKILIKRE